MSYGTVHNGNADYVEYRAADISNRPQILDPFSLAFVI